MASWSGWENAVLAAINAPISTANVAFLDAWQNAEGGSAAYNPLNTTQGPGASLYNSAGVWNFESAAQGAQQTAATLLNGYYPNIIAALRSGNPSSYYGQIAGELDTWGTGSGFIGITGSTSSIASGVAATAKEWPKGTQIAVIIPAVLGLGWLLWGALR